MLKEEFEKLAGVEVDSATYEVVNAMYMSNDNIDKKDFVKGLMQMGLLMYAKSNAASTAKLRKEVEAQTARAMAAERELARMTDLKKQHEDFVKTIAVQCHDYDESFIEGTCCGALGAKADFTTLRDAGCTPSRNDLDMMIKYMEGE